MVKNKHLFSRAFVRKKESATWSDYLSFPQYSRLRNEIQLGDCISFLGLS